MLHSPGIVYVFGDGVNIITVFFITVVTNFFNNFVADFFVLAVKNRVAIELVSAAERVALLDESFYFSRKCIIILFFEDSARVIFCFLNIVGELVNRLVDVGFGVNGWVDQAGIFEEFNKFWPVYTNGRGGGSIKMLDGKVILTGR